MFLENCDWNGFSFFSIHRWAPLICDADNCIARHTDFSSTYGFLQTYKFWEEKYGFLKFFENLTWFLLKVPITSKNASNKSCPKLNFQWKTHWMHISISSRSGARGHQTFAIFKWRDRVEKQIHFRTERFKSTDYIEKYLNQKSSKIKFPAKTLLGGRICQSLPVVELEDFKDLPF